MIQKFIAQKYGEDKVVTLFSETKNKDDSIYKFKNTAQYSTAQYLIAHPQSAGHGLTFTNCNTAVFFSLDFSFESHIQARNRIHRIGQKNNCLYIYIIAEDTIDEELLNILQKKKTLQAAVYDIVVNKARKPRNLLRG